VRRHLPGARKRALGAAFSHGFHLGVHEALEDECTFPGRCEQLTKAGLDRLQEVTAETVELPRRMFHCPSWCVVPLAEHHRALSECEGGAFHRSEPVQIPAITEYDVPDEINVFVTTDADGTIPANELTVSLSGWDHMSPAKARTLVAAVSTAIDLAETP
jgi:hypothetical protein